MIEKQNKTTLLYIIIILALFLIMFTTTEALANDSNEGSFNFTGNGESINVFVKGLDWASVDFTNPWRFEATIKYVNVKDGNIFLRVNQDYDYDPMYYYNWKTKYFKGNGSWTLPNEQGGRNVTIINGENISGFIEYPERDRKAVFLFDTRHHHADLKVIVHNGHLLENATVSLINGNQEIKWTDKNGIAIFNPGTGTYHMIIEHENFSAMIVNELFIESSKSYIIKINMTDGLTSSDTNDLIIYYKEKDPAMNSISNQEYVNYFAERLSTCKGKDDPEADGTLERMATKWGIYPEDLNVLLYSCNFTEINNSNKSDWIITYIVKNYQQYECNYNTTLIIENKNNVTTTIPMGEGIVKATWSEYAKDTKTQTVNIGTDMQKMYLIVIGNQKL